MNCHHPPPSLFFSAPPQPTNGLDIESIDALSKAIECFEGGVVLVSHDMRLIQGVVKQIYECKDGKIELFKGDILSYKKKLSDVVMRMDEEAKARSKSIK